jgi:hypothetical protein
MTQPQIVLPALRTACEVLHVLAFSDHTHQSIQSVNMFLVLTLLSIGPKNGEKKCGVEKAATSHVRTARRIFKNIHYLLTQTVLAVSSGGQATRRSTFRYTSAAWTECQASDR